MRFPSTPNYLYTQPPQKTTIKHAKEHASVCATAQLTLLEMRGPGVSQFHTYEGQLLFTERSIRKEIAKEERAPTTGPEAGGSEGGTHNK